MKTIWKFPIPPRQYFKLEMPRGARIIAVQTQDGAPNMWAEVQPDQPSEVRSFLGVETGNLIPETNLEYVGTCQLNGGTYVFHLYEDLS